MLRVPTVCKVLACVLGVSVSLGGAGAAELPKAIKDSGTIRMLADAIYPPMEYHDIATGKLTGLDIDLGNEIGRRLGLKVEWVEASFAQLISSLQTSRGDVIMSSMGDTPGRQETLDFIDYLYIGGQFYTLQSTPGLKAETDLCGKTVITGRSTGFPAQIKAWSDANCVAAGRPEIQVLGADNIADSRVALQQGRADAAAMGGHALRYNMEQFPNTFRPIGTPFTDQQAGATFLKSDAALRDAVHEAMNAMVADGTYKRILDQWKMGDLAIIPLHVNAKAP